MSGLMVSMLYRCADKFPKERMCVRRAGLELGVKLASYKPWMIGKLDHFHETIIGANSAHNQSF